MEQDDAQPEVSASSEKQPSSAVPRHAGWLLRLAAVAATAAAIGIVLSLILVTAIWALAMPSALSPAELFRLAGLAWLASQGAPAYVDAVALSLAPWGLGLVSILVLFLGARRVVTRLDVRTHRDGWWLAAAVLAGAFVYAVLAAWVADASWVATSRTESIDAAWRAAVWSVLALGAGAVAGLLRASDSDDERIAPPRQVMAIVKATGVGVFAVLGIGAFAVALSLLAHFDDAVTLQQSLAAGAGGGFGLFLVALAYLPVLSVWGAAYVLGAGVVIGPGVTASPFVAVTAPTSLPAMPVLAAVPQQASPLAWLLPVLVIACGLLAGLSVARSFRSSPKLLRAGLAVLVAALIGVAFFVLAWLASGSLGDQRLAYVGPVSQTAGILTFVLIVLGAVPASILGSQRGRSRHLAVAPAQDDETDLPEQQPIAAAGDMHE